MNILNKKEFSRKVVVISVALSLGIGGIGGFAIGIKTNISCSLVGFNGNMAVKSLNVNNNNIQCPWVVKLLGK